MDRFDLVIVGAGPGGSATALRASELGLRTLIVEKQREVGRNILCAEGVSQSFLNMVKPEKGVASIIKKAGLIFENGVSIYIERKEGFGAILERKIFDRLLFERAVSKGAIPMVGMSFTGLVKENNGYRITLEGKEGHIEVYADNVVGADGPGSLVSLKAGIKNNLFSGIVHYCSQVYLYSPKIKGDTILFYFGENIAPGGYGWVFPKGDGYANVGIGTTLKGNASMEYLKSFLEKYYPEGKILGFLRGTVPSGGLDMEFQKERVLLVGDAARFADPLSGGGIANAYISGLIAAESIAEDNVESYRNRIKKVFEKDYRISMLVRDVVYSLTEEEIELFSHELKKIFDGKELSQITSQSILKTALSISPSLWGLLIKKGGKSIANTVRKLIS